MKKRIISLLLVGLSVTVFAFPAKASANTLSRSIQTQYLAQSTADKFVAVKPVHKYDTDGDTPWRKIDNTIYEASITGRGIVADDEGYSTVLIRNTKNNTYSEFKFQPKDPNAQRTAYKVTCGSGNIIYVIVGSAYGMGYRCGDLYSLNVVTGETKLAAKGMNEYEKISDAKVDGNKLVLTCALFNENYSDFVMYTRSVNR